VGLAEGYFALHHRRHALPYERSLKRFLDLVLATVGLIGSLPIWLAIVIAIRVDSPGPAIFVQERVGLHGRRFRFYKFRSMYLDAEARLAEVQAHNEMDGPVFKIRKDPRVSKVGAFLRRTSLDELPQLLNVIKGDMSLVGPRPPLPREVEQTEMPERGVRHQ
jgi:lipopolysaccharide/colanic/teichoic acid biosynthesis glycosyltransferase